MSVEQNQFLYTALGSDNDKDILKVNIFFTVEHLDLIESLEIGNIIRIQRLNVTGVPRSGDLSDERKNILSKVDFEHKNTSFVVFSSDMNSDYSPLISTSETYSFNAKDREIIERMRKDWNNTLRETWESYFKEKKIPIQSCTSIENLKANQFVCVLTKVIDKTISIASSKKATLILWDGTGDDMSFAAGSSENEQPLIGNTIQCHTWNEEIIRQCEEDINVGMWVYICGAKTNIYQEILELKLFKTSAVRVMEEDSPQVKLVLKNYREKIRAFAGNTLNDGIKGSDEEDENEDNILETPLKKTRRNSTEEDENEDNIDETVYENVIVTDTPYPHIPITTIEDVKAASNQVPNKFKIHVSLVQHIPLNILDFTRILCINDGCGKTSQYRDENVNPDLITCLHCGSGSHVFIYLFKLIVKDQTGELPIIFYYEATKFLNLHPTNLYIDKKSLGHIEDKMNFLKKPRVSFDLCIQSYYEEGKEETLENIKYQAFDTKLLISEKTNKKK
ncbi:hypothetical protein DICPUDRAFT_36163 [Dictyostelium purpureum]|uniref:Telomeric single stranded DNA binding POT1/Cdc13 domain-containing protein n=1 Tax=Dictyostelium purpureum TaxID=5786 RepID=F0ZQK6_DICPU|nr:uncharacterized protein DICPUDRAFT_36163 [Dictyostelium purpureum]EGC33769.1 hypothetical protein DICPUDRAFT_36163 [Dictyostelium purpureum]|eukprot:XP_003289694.1 hypothetical protein DICPUDRAFT_36163 [Dictyostelium purpureum]